MAKKIPLKSQFFCGFFHFQSPSCEISPQIETVQVPNQAVGLRHLESKPSKPFQTAKNRNFK
jgi:hypothetical protein